MGGATARAGWTGVTRLAAPALLTAVLIAMGGETLVAQEPGSGAEAGASGDPVPGPATAADGNRVVVPEAGYALTFPEGWDVFADVDSTIVERPEGRRVRLTLLADGPLDPDEGLAVGCHVSHYLSAGASLEATVADDVAGILEAGDQLLRAPQTTLLALPAGTAMRVEYAVAYPAFTKHYAAYTFADGTFFHRLFCSGPAAPEDAWLSIAETWEYLAADGAGAADGLPPPLP